MSEHGAPYVRGWKKNLIEREAAGAMATLFLAPAILAAAGTMIDTRSLNPFFPQTRPLGWMLKFKSLRDEADRPLATYDTYDPRASVWGNAIRKVSVDEYPQLVQAAAGTMGVYGYRDALPIDRERMQASDPALYADLEQAIKESKVKPSLFSPSSMWRKSIRYDVTDPSVRKMVDIESMRRDTQYLTEDASLRTDIRAMVALPRVVLSRSLSFSPELSAAHENLVAATVDAIEEFIESPLAPETT